MRLSLQSWRLLTDGLRRFGSYDPELAAFIPMEQFGTAADSGTPVGGTAAGNCVTGFDNAGVILGISSNLFVRR